jgi:hypothetical protein
MQRLTGFRKTATECKKTAARKSRQQKTTALQPFVLTCRITVLHDL